jgi:hypothetical protein
MYTKKHRRNEFVPLMVELVRLYHPKTYVEVGVAEGYTFNQMVQMPQIDRLVAVDVRPVRVTPGGRVEIWQMSSQEFAKKWKDPIDMLFIDGDHNKETVEHDFFEIGKFVRTGTGLILLHDTHPMTEELLSPRRCNNAWEFANELFGGISNQYEMGGLYIDDATEYMEILTLPGPWAGMTMVKKRGRHHLCWKNKDG